jgi:hypothetical protein
MYVKLYTPHEANITQFALMARMGNTLSDTLEGTEYLVERAYMLAHLYSDDGTETEVGVMGLKRPRESYRDKIVSNAGIDFDALKGYAELGWAYIEPQARGQDGLKLMGMALLHYAEKENIPVYTVVESYAGKRQALLEEAGFEWRGGRWRSEWSGKEFMLYTKKSAQSACTDYL